MSLYQICPVPKPRQTRRDKWEARPSVLAYRAFADECRLRRIQIPPSGAHVTFHLPMPESWSGKKKARMAGLPHQSRPDLDNLLKALLDAVHPDEDSAVWDIHARKIWAPIGAIEVAFADS